MSNASPSHLSGIYSLANIITDMVYVGMSYDISFRCFTHLTKLKNNQHINPKLQEDFNTYGARSFTFEVLERIPVGNEKLMREREKYWIKQFPLVYNIGPGNNPNSKQIDQKGVRIEQLNTITIESSAYVTIKELAQYFSITKGSVNVWVHSGTFPNYIIHTRRTILVPISDLLPYSKE